LLESKGKGSGEKKERDRGQNKASTSVYQTQYDPFNGTPIDIDDADLPF